MALTKTTDEFRIRWEGRTKLRTDELVAMMSDMFRIIEELEKRITNVYPPTR